MAVDAMSFAEIASGGTISAEHIVATRYHFQVEWVDARWIPAEVIKRHATLDGTNERLISKTMCKFHFSVNTKLSIVEWWSTAFRTSPQNTVPSVIRNRLSMESVKYGWH